MTTFISGTSNISEKKSDSNISGEILADKKAEDERGMMEAVHRAVFGCPGCANPVTVPGELLGGRRYVVCVDPAVPGGDRTGILGAVRRYGETIWQTVKLIGGLRDEKPRRMTVVEAANQVRRREMCEVSVMMYQTGMWGIDEAIDYGLEELRGMK